MQKILIVTDPACTQHLTGPGHVESPARYHAISNALEKAELKTPQNTILPRSASPAELMSCHTKDYIETVKRDCETAESLAIKDGSYTLSTGDVQICPDSWKAALLAASAALTCVDAIFEGKAKRAFSLMRPPGHHACRSAGMGFCIFNNVALAAKYAQSRYNIRKALIVDWDVHHGNGTQDIFNSDPTVFYFSTHQKGIYPGTGSSLDTGLGRAKGTKRNFPIFPGLLSRIEVVKAYDVPLKEAMASFKPELVLISCGFDAHYGDPVGEFNLIDSDFAELTRLVCEIADKHAHGRVISVLEGGYNLSNLATSAVSHVRALSL